MDNNIIIIGVILLILLLYIIIGFNKLNKAKKELVEQFVKLDEHLKKKFDLIPSLVQIIGLYVRSDSDIIINLNKLSNRYMKTRNRNKKILLANNLKNYISKVFALVDSYPELRVNSNFMQAQMQLKTLEENILYTSEFYNNEAKKYNRKLYFNFIFFILGYSVAKTYDNK